MTDEIRDRIHQITELLDNGDYINPEDIDWGDITDGFEEDAMMEVLDCTYDDNMVDMIISAISHAWEEAINHEDPICYKDTSTGRYEKYDERYSIDYVLEKLRKKRVLNVNFELQNGTRGTAYLNIPRKKDSNKKNEKAKMKKEIETLKAENESLKQQLAEAPRGQEEETIDTEKHLLGLIENKPILALVWKLMQQDGAEIKKHGDTKIANEILSMITGFPYNSCKKVWEVGNRPITRKADDIAKLNQYMKAIGMKIQI